MKTACFIPIKSNSERVKGKNFKILNGKKLYEYIIEHVIEADVFDDIYIDTNSDEIARYAEKSGCNVIERKEELSRNSANGNDLLNYHFELYPDYDYYFQLFATSPFLQVETIKKCVDKLVYSAEYDSCFTATAQHGFFWLNNEPINYRPCILPRSQDMAPMIEETTGLYGISREALKKYRCRIGAKPYIHYVEKFEAVDINTEVDFKMAEYIGKHYWKINYDKGESNNMIEKTKSGGVQYKLIYIDSRYLTVGGAA